MSEIKDTVIGTLLWGSMIVVGLLPWVVLAWLLVTR